MCDREPPSADRPGGDHLGPAAPAPPRGRRSRRAATVGLLAVLFVLAAPAGAMAHGDSRLVDEVLSLAPGASARFDGDLHYHRLVGEVAADGPVHVRFVAAGTDRDVLGVDPGTAVSFNALIRCCDMDWAPHTLIIDNPGDTPVTVTARAHLVHDDLAVMVDAAEDGTRISIVVMALGWAALVWRAARRRDAAVPLRRSAVGIALLTIVVVGLGTYATVRYGVGGAPSVVAGNADVPVLPMNGLVSRASLLMGLAMLGWARVGLWWVRAAPGPSRWPWLAVGGLLAGAVLVVALAVTVAYGGPLVQLGWVVGAAGPIVAVMLTRERRHRPSRWSLPATATGPRSPARSPS